MNDEGEGEWASGSGTTERAELTVAFSSATHTVDEGSNTDITVNVDPDADRDVTVTITMTGTGAALSGLTDGMLTIAREQSSGSFTISAGPDDDTEDGSITLALTTDEDKVTLGSPSTATVTIVDTEEPNNPPSVTTTSPITIQENQTAVTTLEATTDQITGWSTGGSDRSLSI